MLTDVESGLFDEERINWHTVALFVKTRSAFSCMQHWEFYLSEQEENAHFLKSLWHKDVYRMWYPEVQDFCPNTPIVVVGLSRDCCNDKSVISELKVDDPDDPCAPLTCAEGWRLAKDIGAVKYVECTSFNQDTVDNVFREAACAAMNGVAQR